MTRKMKMQTRQRLRRIKSLWSDASLTNPRRSIILSLIFRKTLIAAFANDAKSQGHRAGDNDVIKGSPMTRQYQKVSVIQSPRITPSQRKTNLRVRVRPLHWSSKIVRHIGSRPSRLKPKAPMKPAKVSSDLWEDPNPSSRTPTGARNSRRHVMISATVMTRPPHTAPKPTVWRKGRSDESKREHRAHSTNLVYPTNGGQKPCCATVSSGTLQIL